MDALRGRSTPVKRALNTQSCHCHCHIGPCGTKDGCPGAGAWEAPKTPGDPALRGGWLRKWMCPSPAILRHRSEPVHTAAIPSPPGPGTQEGAQPCSGHAWGWEWGWEWGGLEPKRCWHHEEPLQHREPLPWESQPSCTAQRSLPPHCCLSLPCPFPDLSCPSCRAPWRLIPTGRARSDSRYSHVSSVQPSQLGGSLVSLLGLSLTPHTESIHLPTKIAAAALFDPRMKEKVQSCLQIGMAGEEHYKNA